MTDHPDYWNRIYEDQGRPGWDMDGATPLVGELLDLALPLGLRPGGDLVVPGCGYGHDAVELAARGFAVTGLDFAPLAIQGAMERYGDRVAWSQADWFSTQLGPWGPVPAPPCAATTPAGMLRKEGGAGTGPWDAIFDHTCFVAMDPARRPAYVDACAHHLRPGGLWLAVVFHDVNGRPGPPHAVPMADMRLLAESRFEVLHLADATFSHPRRAGREFLLVARRRQD